MTASSSKRVIYDMPPEQVEYFDSRTRAPPVFEPSAPVRLLYDKTTPGCGHEMPRRTQHLLEKRDEEVLTTNQRSLFEKYQHYFPENIRRGSDSHLLRAGSAASSFHGVEGIQPHQTRSQNVTVQTPAAEAPSRASPVPRAHLSVKRNVFSQLHSHQDATLGTNHLHLGRNVPIKFDGSFREEQTVSNKSHSPLDRTHLSKGDPWVSKNEYEQSRGDRQAPARKSSGSHDILASCDSSQLSTGSRPQNQETRHLSHAPMHKKEYHPQRTASEKHNSHYSTQRPVTPTVSERYGTTGGDNEYFSHHPTINRPSHIRKSDVREFSSPERKKSNSRGRSSRDYKLGLHDRLHHHADAAKRRNESRRVQQEINKTELERNTSSDSHSNIVNTRQSVGGSHADPQEVFSRLYADALRYNNEKREQERLIELKRRQERGEVDDGWDKNGRNHEEPLAHSDLTTLGGNETSPTKGRSFTERTMATATAETFERLSRPQRVTPKFEKLKEEEELQRREKERRDSETKKNEVERFAGYQWGIPSKSFTFADLESHNAL